MVNAAFALVSCFTSVDIQGRAYGWAQAEILVLLQIVIAGGMFYAATQMQKGREIGQKAFPASLVSYLLWLGMLRFWWLAGQG